MSEALKRDYQICEEIGKGQFGTIFRCLNPTTGECFACKSIDKSQIHDELDLQLVQNEPKTMSYLTPHPNIINLHDLYEDKSHIYMILDLCQPFTSLYDVVSNAPLSEPQAASLIKPVIEAVAHCHRHGISHRDIKPENILLGYGNNNLKLADFGSAEWFGEGRTMEGIVGTPYYVAPEVLLGRGYNEKVDVWSLGVVLYVMLAGFVPFNGEDAGEIFEAVIRGNLRFPTKVFRNVSKEAKDLLRKMICRDVSRRLSADQVLRHPWIVSGGETEAAELDLM